MLMRSIAVLVGLAALARPGLGQTDRLSELYDQRLCFELAHELQNKVRRGDLDHMFFEAASFKMFNRPERSLNLIETFLKKAPDNDARLREAFHLKAESLRSLSRYGEAAAAFRSLLEKFGPALSNSEKADYQNAARLCEVLTSVPPQTAVVAKTSTIKGTGKIAKWDLIVTANGSSIEMGVDTGANYSLVPVSTAQKLGIKIFEQRIDVGTINSAKVKARLGLLPEMKIGNALVRNAVFLVMEDKELTFSDGFFLTGVVGFPVLSALKEITLKRDGSVVIRSQAATGGVPDLCLNGTDLLFQANYEGAPLTFTLDTGAGRTDLYLPFFRRFESEIKKTAENRNETVTGAGGSENLPAYILKHFRLTISGRTVELPEVRLFTRVFGEKSRRFYGNIGRDVFQDLDEITLNFRSMRISVK